MEEASTDFYPRCFEMGPYYIILQSGEKQMVIVLMGMHLEPNEHIFVLMGI